MKALLTLTLPLLLSMLASAADDPATFREAASLALVEIGLRDVPNGAYACVSVDDRRASDEQLAKFRALGSRELGPRDECICVEGDPVDTCMRIRGGQKACLLSVRALGSLVDNMVVRRLRRPASAVIVGCAQGA